MKKFIPIIFALFFFNVSWGDSSVATQPNALIITCVDKGDINCKLPSDNTLTPLKNCAELANDPLYENGVLYLDYTDSKNCTNHDKISESINKTKCPAYNVAMIDQTENGKNKLVLFCITNPNIEIKYTNDPTDQWSYEQKKCVGSWGTWQNGSCKCIGLEGTQEIDNECICTENNDQQKYYNKLWSGCKTLEDGVLKAGSSSERLYGGNFTLSTIDKANSCSISGGKWGGYDNNTCSCDTQTLHLELHTSGYYCNCQKGYRYKDPLAKTIGCEEIPTNSTSNEAPTSTDVSANTPTEQTLTDACTYSGGKYQNGECVCDADKHLEKYEPENAPEYSVCKCMYGYKRKDGTLDTDGRTVLSYTDGAECEYAGTETIEKVFDSVKWRKDTENAYKHERDNTQSWANKGITAGSTLLTGEGAMMAAQAWAEQNADKRAEEQMNAYITTMKCEYGGGQQVDLGKEETLPGGNELSKNYTEYKQLADKLKAIKTALNMRPGIESEVLYEKAETGLYNYQTAERQSGTYASVARALMDTTGTDAERWNAQRAETVQNLKTGALLAAGGVVVGAAGNYLLNRNHEPTKLQQSIDKVVVEVEEKLPAFTYTPAPVNITYQEPKTEIYLGENGGRAQIPTLTELKPKQNALTLNGDTTFDRNKATLKDTTKIEEFVDRLNTEVLATMTTNQEISINIIGHTDRTGNDKINNPLSLKRAQSVEKYIKERISSPDSLNQIHYESIGVGSKECSTSYCDGNNDCELCRKVVVTIEDITKTQE